MRRLILLNVVALTSIIFASLYYVSMFLIQEWFIAFIFIGVQILLSISLLLNYLGRYNYAKFIVFVSTNYIVLILSISVGHSAGFYLYYFTAPLVVFSLFEHSEFKKMIAFVIFYLSSYVIIAYYQIPFNIGF